MKNFNKYFLGMLVISFATLANADNVYLINKAQSTGTQPYRLSFRVEHCLDINCKKLAGEVAENVSYDEPTRQIYPSSLIPESGVVAVKVVSVFAMTGNPPVVTPPFTDFQACMARVTGGNANLNIKILTIYDASGNVITDASCSTPPLK